MYLRFLSQIYNFPIINWHFQQYFHLHSLCFPNGLPRNILQFPICCYKFSLRIMEINRNVRGISFLIKIQIKAICCEYIEHLKKWFPIAFIRNVAEIRRFFHDALVESNDNLSSRTIIYCLSSSVIVEVKFILLEFQDYLRQIKGMQMTPQFFLAF